MIDIHSLYKKDCCRLTITSFAHACRPQWIRLKLAVSSAPSTARYGGMNSVPGQVAYNTALEIARRSCLSRLYGGGFVSCSDIDLFRSCSWTPAHFASCRCPSGPLERERKEAHLHRYDHVKKKETNHTSLEMVMSGIQMFLSTRSGYQIQAACYVDTIRYGQQIRFFSSITRASHHRPKIQNVTSHDRTGRIMEC